MSFQLKGNFINLRPISVEDAELTLAWRQSPRAQFLNRGATSLKEQQEWIRSRPESEYNFIIETRKGLSIGTYSLTEIDFANSRAEPGRFIIGNEKAVRGVPAAAEATFLVYRFTFDELGLHRVHGLVAADNTKMIKWQKYLGMNQEGTLKDHYYRSGNFYDAICFGMNVKEYRRKCEPRLNSLVAMALKLPAYNH